MHRTDMSPDTANDSPESDVTSMNFSDTELTLGLPGEARSSMFIGGRKSCCTTRGFSHTTVDLQLGSSICMARGETGATDMSETEASSSNAGKTPAAKAKVVGWPPVRPSRKKAMKTCSTYVKVAVDGAPYLRKVDLEMYGCYQDLLRALEEMITCFTISWNFMDGSTAVEPVKGTEYVPTYEDKDGDWMLVGDVPWKMFIETCKRVRLMKSTEAIGFAPRTPPNCSSSCIKK